MPRFRDEWLIDKVLFDYVNGGTCACCSFTIFLPGGTAELISAVTDIETDQAAAEVAALSNHPWPQDLRDHVWASRVKLRQRLKSDLRMYASFWNEHAPQFQQWCYNNPVLLNRIFQLSRSELNELLEHKYGIHSAYKAVMETVVEQVASFHLTDYPIDGKGNIEIQFEQSLGYTRTGRGFYIDIITNNDNTGNNENAGIDEESIQIWFQRMKSLGGPKLLDRATSSVNNDDDNDNNNNNDNNNDGDTDDVVPMNRTQSTGPSFQSDRRMIRLMIARYWADLLIQRYLNDTSRTDTTPETTSTATVTSETATTRTTTTTLSETDTTSD